MKARLEKKLNLRDDVSFKSFHDVDKIDLDEYVNRFQLLRSLLFRHGEGRYCLKKLDSSQVQWLMKADIEDHGDHVCGRSLEPFDGLDEHGFRSLKEDLEQEIIGSDEYEEMESGF